MGRESRFEPHSSQTAGRGTFRTASGRRAAAGCTLLLAQKKPAHGGLVRRLELGFSKPRVEPIFELLSFGVHMAADTV